MVSSQACLRESVLELSAFEDGIAVPRKSMKAILRYFFRSYPARMLTLLLMVLARLMARLMNEARARALFPRAPDCVCHWTTEVKYPENITLGRRVIIGSHCTIGAAASIFLGDDVHLSKGVILDTGKIDISKPVPFPPFADPITVHRGTWIGAGAIVLGGVTIGENSVIAAGAVVRKNVPPDSFVVGERVRVQSFRRLEVDLSDI
jgi:acetyltransferase-like isoleucine patch superfamily enzyme